MNRKLISAGLLAAALLVPSLSRAVDRDDVYAYLYGGTRLDRNLQGGFGVGYAPIDAVGVGIAFDQTYLTTQICLEARWFIEPFEVSGGVGATRLTVDNGHTHQTAPAFTAGATYLFALTPALALRAEFRLQYLIRNTSSALVGLGGRLVF